MKALAQQTNDLLFEGKISVTQWEKDIAYSLKQASIWQYAIGIGGVGRLDYRDYGIVGAEMRFQLQHLRQFSQDVLAGNLSEAQIKARLDLYLERTRSLYERGRLEGHKANGYVWERRSLSASESCQECINYAGHGWVPIGTLPQIGNDCSCKANCKCSFEFSNSISRPD